MADNSTLLSKRTFRFWLACLALLAAAWLPLQAMAAAKPAAPAKGLSQAELKTLVHTLENKQEREQFLKRLNTLIGAQQALTAKTKAPPPRGVQQQVTEWLGQLHARTGRWAAQLEGFARAKDVFNRVTQRLSNPKTRALWLRQLGEMLAVLFIAGFVAWLCRRLLRPSVRRVTTGTKPGRLLKVLRLTGRTLLQLAPTALFVAVGYALVGTLHVGYVATVVTLAVINALGLSVGIQTLVREIITPEAASLRVLPITEETANYWALWLRRFIVVGVYGFVAVNAAAAIGLPWAQAQLLNNVLGLIITVMLILLVVQNRGTVRGWLRGLPREESPRAVKALIRRTGDLWHVVAVIYVVAIYLVGVLQIPNGVHYLVRATLLSAVVLLIAKGVGTVLERGLNRLFAVSPDLKRRLPGLEKRVNRYVPVMMLSVRWFIYFVAGLVILQVWRLNILGWLTTATGQQVIGTAVTIIITVAVATAVWETLNLAIENYLLERTDSNGNHRTPSARALTVMPLLRAVLAITLGTITALIVLSQLGINIAPLLAGAGILGLAVGFGSQTLVKDFITGLFILLQDIVAVGDVVQMAGSIGTVEALSIRSIRLRDLNGNVHVIPFSEVTSVTNMTKDFSYAVFDVGVAYRENMDEVMQAMKTLTDEMREDPQWAPSILAEAEVFGVNALGDSAITVRLRMKTKAGTQWGIQREFNRRVKQRFDELGIEIPFPHQTIYFGEGKDGTAPPAHVALAAQAGQASATPQAPAADAPAPEAPAPETNNAPPAQGDPST